MDVDELYQQYRHKSNLQLLLIATNYDGGYTEDAIEAATSLLFSKYPSIKDIARIWEIEWNSLNKLAERCSVCQSQDIAYTSKI